ncbi:uncharacterized protein LOC119081141 [Bradysia coprophila]|uniref:uncharacterized protein LOC119081141 n=1 Tax=Bradysia coprophila TaxID=38358 RepID=UPI00187D945F|nr:uncharacterized protein LOC119081141 [Bradysia coprophila]
MKSICFLLSFLLINSLQLVIGDGDDDAASILTKCQIEVDAPDDEVKLIVDKKMPTSHIGFCLLTCLYEHAGIIEDGEFVVENLNKLIGGSDGGSVGGRMAKQFIKEVTKDCKDVHNDDKCYLSRDIVLCAAESISKHASLLKEL